MSIESVKAAIAVLTGEEEKKPQKRYCQLGFTELFGIGLWAKEEFGTVVDTNSGTAKVIPHIEASFDNYVGFAETVVDLNAAIEKSENSEFFINERARAREQVRS